MRTRHRLRHARVLSGIVAGLALFSIALLRSKAAPTNTWSGGGTDNNWTTPGNWSGSVAPSPGNNLNFPWISSVLGNSATPINNFADGTVFGQINVGIVNLANVKSYIFSGNRVVVTNGISVNGGLGSATFDLNITLGADQTFIASRSLTFNDWFDFAGHNLYLENSSSVTISGVLTNSSNSNTGGHLTKTNGGTLTIASTTKFPLFQPVSITTDQGSLIIDAAATNTYFYADSTGSIVLDGQAYSVEVDSTNATISGTGTSGFLQSLSGGIVSAGDNGVPGILNCDRLYLAGDFDDPPGTLQVKINNPTPGTGYSQVQVFGVFALSFTTSPNVLYPFQSTLLDANPGYAAQIGDSFLVLKQMSGVPYYISDSSGTDDSGIFYGLPPGSIYDTTNGYSMGILYDTDGVTLTTVRTPASPFALWKGSGNASDLTYLSRYWSASNNWAQELVPANGSRVQFGPYQFVAYTSSNGFGPFILPLTNDLSPGTSLGSLEFSGTNYFLYGNPLTISGGISNHISTGTNFCYFDLVAAGSLTVESDPSGTFVLDDSINGSGNLSKEGGGLLIYTGTTMNQFFGTVVVDNGTLQVNGSFTDGSFTVNGGLLDGTGTVSSVTLNGGTLKPGDSPGVLHIQGDLAMAPGAVFRAELNGPVPGSGYGQLQVNGTVNLNGATLNLVPGFTPAPGTAFLILVNDGTDPTVGTFAGLPEGAIFEASGQFFSISYRAGSGSNDVVVSSVAAPANLSGITQLNASTMQLQGTGGSNATYTILANTNLATTNWASIGAATANSSGIFFFNDTNAALFPERFFRVQAP